MKRKFVKILLLLTVVLAVLGLSGYMLMMRLFDVTEKMILDNIDIADLGTETSQPPALPEPAKNEQGEDGKPDVSEPGTISDKKEQKKEEPEREEPGQNKKSQEITEVEKLSSTISFEDKRRILQLVTKSLKSEDIKYLGSLLKGGLTSEKKQLAVELALKRFGPEDIKELQGLYNKYKKYTY